jgi:hypothetical protein
MDAGNWTWLEVAKLIVAALTPIAIAFAGVYSQDNKEFLTYSVDKSKVN